MPKQISFRFLNPSLNKKLVASLKKAKVVHTTDASGTIRYSPQFDNQVQNEILPKIRDGVFDSWQLVSCPKNWVSRYKDYMQNHEVPYREELADNELWFLIPRSYRPHKWVFEDSHSAVS